MKYLVPYSAVFLTTLVTLSVAPGTPSHAQDASKPSESFGDRMDQLREALPMLNDKERRGLALQVALDRSGFSPGVIDGRPGPNTDRAMTAYNKTKGTTELGAAYSNPVARYTISADDVAGPFVAELPEDMMDQAELPALGYTSVLELLAERFHTTPALLQRLNPKAAFAQGEIIAVPNVEPFSPPLVKSSAPRAGEAPANRSPDAPKSAATPERNSAAPEGEITVVVTDRTKSLEVQNAAGAVIFHAPVTVGSEQDPLPVGEWKVNGVQRNPRFHYNPELFWDADPTHAKATIAPGPNNPVGVIWIDLSKEHYGIHGTPEPSRIGFTQSHGCIRLTNWDAVRLAELVRPGTKVILR